MSRAWQAERGAELEQKALDDRADELSPEEYNRQCREIERDVRGAYEEDLLDAQQVVRDEWGY